MDLEAIQHELRRQRVDGWLFCDHHGRDPLAYRILGLHPGKATRRWYFLIPATGDPWALVHRIEEDDFSSLPGGKLSYSSWREQIDGLQRILRTTRRVAMQYSPLCRIPGISMVDAGTVELVRQSGPEVVTSSELVQVFEARLDEQTRESHFEAGRRVDRTRAEAFSFIRDSIASRRAVSEYAVQQFIRRRFSELGLTTDHGPIVAVNANSAKPHYEPTESESSLIGAGDFVLIDMWAKVDVPHAVYYDITWTGFCGSDPPQQYREIFQIVRDARDAAISLVENALQANTDLRGFEVDDAARSVIRARGYENHFPHRTGHSIGQEVHGSGANMDNLEIHDERKLIPWTCFSIEPGIYTEEFGIRSEVNIFLDDSRAHVTGETQQQLVVI